MVIDLQNGFFSAKLKDFRRGKSALFQKLKINKEHVLCAGADGSCSPRVSNKFLKRPLGLR